MGLGKTIQGVASMSIYHKEWPILVLCPSGARYHWENEFKQWLGVDSAVNKSEQSALDRMFPDSRKKATNGPLLHERQIHVLTSSKSIILPDVDTKVVICSYGLSSALIESGKIVSGLFRCAIVDESHMLKNKATKRTSTLLPILNATNRCVLLSGTPALARPIELWPQLSILGTEQHGWGSDEQDFIDKYVKNGNSRRSAELHTMLRGTVMIRRLKNDILKTMPRKIREKAEVHVVSSSKQRQKFKDLMMQLRESKGALGNLARIHQTEIARGSENMSQTFMSEVGQDVEDHSAASNLNTEQQTQRAQAHAALQSAVKQRLVEGRSRIERIVNDQSPDLDTEQRDNIVLQMEGNLSMELERFYNDGLLQIDSQYSEEAKEHEENKRTTLLSGLYSLTGDVKIPLIVDTLKRWLADPTKGKICIFAHHISVLNAIRDGAGLSNAGKSSKKFIRIDGSTLPKLRQEQITAFQTDPSIRVALLGITAAGVAVTLTASSTVWFAELFWTPAIMIQAEGKFTAQISKAPCFAAVP